MSTTAVPGRSSAGASRIALAALLTGAIAISFSGIFVKLSEVGPISTAFYRTALAVPVLWVLMQSEKPRDGTAAPSLREDRRWLVLSGLFFAGDLATWHWSFQYTSVANATLLANFAPIPVTLFAWLVRGERVTRLFLVGMALALGGAIVLMSRSFTVSTENLFGDGLALVTAMFYGGYILTIAKLRARHSAATIMCWSSAVTAAVLLPMALLSGETFIAVTAAGWAVLAGIALVSQAGGQNLIAYALAHLPTSFSSVSLLVQPVAAAILAWIILGEAIGPWQVVGGVAVLIGIVVARRGSRGG